MFRLRTQLSVKQLERYLQVHMGGEHWMRGRYAVCASTVYASSACCRCSASPRRDRVRVLPHQLQGGSADASSTMDVPII